MTNRSRIIPMIAAGVVVTGAAGTITNEFRHNVRVWESGGNTFYVPYVDPVGVLTVCDGITNMAAPGWVVKGHVYTQKMCDDMLDRIFITQVFPVLRATIKRPVTNTQWLMLADFAWGVGTGKYRKSTLLKYVNKGLCGSAGDEFNKWVHGGGKRLPGLVRRQKWHSGEWSADCTNSIWALK